MASLRKLVSEYASEIRDGIAWVIFYKVNRSWNCSAIWTNLGIDDVSDYDQEDVKEMSRIAELDPNATAINGYYVARYGRFCDEMTISEIVEVVKFYYEEGKKTGYREIEQYVKDYREYENSRLKEESESRKEPNEQKTGIDKIAEPSWMDESQLKDYREICAMIDTIKSGRDFYAVMNKINCGGYSVDIINAAREIKQCFNSAQYETHNDSKEATVDEPATNNQQEAQTETFCNFCTSVCDDIQNQNDESSSGNVKDVPTMCHGPTVHHHRF